MVDWNKDGIRYEADQRHSEIIVKDLGFEGESNSVVTPCINNSDAVHIDDEHKLEGEQAVQYRAIVARANYLGRDRSDIALAVKELCRTMSNPSQKDWSKLKRLGRYLLNKTRVVVHSSYQEQVQSLMIWTDIDHVGCLKTRKSTSGGVVKFGRHMLKVWSST